jgi:hypothetical protein
LSLPCNAQKEPKAEAATKPPEEFVTKVFEVRHANVEHLASVLGNVFRGSIRGDATMRIIGVHVPKDTLPAIEDVIKRFDVPPVATKNVELTAYLLMGSDQAAPDGAPPELQPVIKQLRNVFSYKGYRLVETLILRSREEGAPANIKGVAPSSAGQEFPPTTYTFGINKVRITSDEKGRVVWLERLSLGARVPIVTGSFQPGAGGVGVGPLANKQFNYMDTGITADVDVREGQKVVVGKANIEGTANALFLVVTAKVAE